MIDILNYQPHNPLPKEEENAIADFLYLHLEQYGDPLGDIQKAIDYALGRDNKPGGLIIVAKENHSIVSAAVINKTGMESYIPENILVYIATHAEQRGKGIGKKMMQEIISTTEGDIALHVDPNSPAKKLYERLGFTNKYLEMRLKKRA